MGGKKKNACYFQTSGEMLDATASLENVSTTMFRFADMEKIQQFMLCYVC